MDWDSIIIGKKSRRIQTNGLSSSSKIGKTWIVAYRNLLANQTGWQLVGEWIRLENQLPESTVLLSGDVQPVLWCATSKVHCRRGLAIHLLRASTGWYSSGVVDLVVLQVLDGAAASAHSMGVRSLKQAKWILNWSPAGTDTKRWYHELQLLGLADTERACTNLAGSYWDLWMTHNALLTLFKVRRNPLRTVCALL